ncbi:uncharacterized protein PITG_16050 [Phytophthora infestans T30-4]|uniref:Uncharacterized protein n=1 Tax=Phytophthora infestans (strain T30-4) TaxID=403677 RepID=D0NSR4_PHYIT|nr:uncharacterized protein PITG_16050 [Phytophthora infestans T30-4]EEY64626.1 hypothetical protein PITG_16050 [Phytophthora infestans T30-4]|eukprot:XP_002897826.1 hypothetical protein PITG_16050 [Phytophthora infestans T30-4]
MSERDQAKWMNHMQMQYGLRARWAHLKIHKGKEEISKTTKRKVFTLTLNFCVLQGKFCSLLEPRDLVSVLALCNLTPISGSVRRTAAQNLTGARTVDEVYLAVAAELSPTYYTSCDVGSLRVQLASTELARQSLENRLFATVRIRENLELLARQVHLRSDMDAKAAIDIRVQPETRRSFSSSSCPCKPKTGCCKGKIARERDAKMATNTSHLNKLHHLLSDLVHGDSSNVQALRTNVATQHDRIERLMHADGVSVSRSTSELWMPTLWYWPPNDML